MTEISSAAQEFPLKEAHRLVRDLMTPNPTTVSPETPTMDIIQSLEEKHLIRMPVVNEEGKLLGVVARRDVLQGYLNAIRVTRIF